MNLLLRFKSSEKDPSHDKKVSKVSASQTIAYSGALFRLRR